MIEWPGLKLEYALMLAQRRGAYVHHVRETLETHRKDLIPPFSFELLRSVENGFKAVSEKSETSLSPRIQSLLANARRMLGKAERAASHVHRLLHQLIRPSGNASLSLLVDTAAAASRDLGYANVPLDVSDAAREAWGSRSVLPFRDPNGRWLPTIPDGDGLDDGVRQFWSRWEILLDEIPALEPFRRIIWDGLRRTFGWSFLVIPGDMRIALPFVVFAGLAPGTSDVPAVRWVGLGGNVSVAPAFARQARIATRAGIDAWLSRNRIGDGAASGARPLQEVYGSTLVLDASMSSATLSDLKISDFRLDDESAGLPTAVGVMGFLSGHPVDPTMWATGTLFQEDRFLDGFKRKHHDGSIVRYDGRVGWIGRRGGRLAEALVAKLLVARTHGIARDLILPVYGAEDALELFEQRVADINNEDGIPTVSVACVPLLSVAADAALPVTYRKVRAVLAPDVLWGFSLGHRARDTPGAHQPLDPARLREGQQLLSRIRDYPAIVISGPPLSGKTYAVCQAITSARRQLHERKRPQPHVTVIRWPRFRGLVEEAWRMTLQALSFPAREIEEFLEAATAEEQARIFVEGFRSYGPDVLILGSIDGRMEEEAKIDDRSSRKSQRAVFIAIGRLLAREPRFRPPLARDVMGTLEVIFESNLLADDALPCETIAPLAWNPQDAWIAVKTRLQQTAIGTEVLRYLGALALPEAAYSGRVLSIVQALLDSESEPDLNKQNRILRCLLSARLVFSTDGFALLSPSEESPPESVETGPLLRESHGRLHVHPLIRDRAANEFDAESSKFVVGRILLRVATQETCPFLSGVHGAGLAPTTALYPERLLQAHDQLVRAEAAFEEAAGQAGIKEERRFLRVCRVELLAHYHDPHHGVSHLLHRLKDKEIIHGAIGNLRRRRAFLLMREYLRRVQSRAHPERWLVLVDMARRLEPEDLADIGPASEPYVVTSRATLEAFIGAYHAALALRTHDAERYRTKVNAWFASWVILHRADVDFPFGQDLPTPFAAARADESLDYVLLHASDDALHSLPLEIFCNAGDGAASQGDAASALRWYHKGIAVMRATMEMRDGGRLYADLALRALAFAAALPMCDKNVASDLLWLEPTYKKSSERHRQNVNINPLMRYALFVMDRRYGIRDATELVSPPVPAIWSTCLPSPASIWPGAPLRLRSLGPSDICCIGESIARMKRPDGAWIELRNWSPESSTEQNSPECLAMYSATGTDNRIYRFVRVLESSEWGVLPNPGRIPGRTRLEASSLGQ